MPIQNSSFISCLHKLGFRKNKGDPANQTAVKLLKYNQNYLPNNFQPSIRNDDPKTSHNYTTDTFLSLKENKQMFCFLPFNNKLNYF